jgi:broad specificity phosphatase PhoE
LTRIFIVRHGQTEWNRDERFRGRVDIPLNDTGQTQARQAARHLASERGAAAIYSSPLQRAIATAAPIADCFNLPVQIEEGLNDLDFGDWQGLRPSEVAERWPDLARRYDLAPHTVTFPGGEDLAALWARASATLNQVARRHPDGTVVLVSHKVVCKALILVALGLDPAHYWQIELDNAAISLVEYKDGVFVVWKVNDTSHLGG